MKHPFDDFIPPSWHIQKADRRVVHVGIALVAVVSIATATAFTTTLSSWKSLLVDRTSVSTKWSDAQLRVSAYLRAQTEVKKAIESTSKLEQYIDSVPRSLLLWEISQLLPEQSILEDMRLETRKRAQENEDPVVTETITLIGKAPTDAAISLYIDKLSLSPYFLSTSLIYAQQDKNGPNRNFSIQLAVNTNAVLAMGTEQR